MVEKTPIIEGAEPFELGSGENGVLLVHGFTGSPQSMRLWGEALATEGFRVSCPLLPGHGTRWQEMQEVKWRDWVDSAQGALDQLTARCSRIFVGGLSMGGTLAAYLAAENQDAVVGIATVCASMVTKDIRLVALPLLKHIVPSFPGIANDVADPDRQELAYDRLPLKALAEFLELQRETRERLGRVKVPAMLFQSRQDHVVDPENMPYIASHIGSEEVTMHWLEKSYHVATLDFDRDEIFRESARFFKDLAADEAAGS